MPILTHGDASYHFPAQTSAPRVSRRYYKSAGAPARTVRGALPPTHPTGSWSPNPTNPLTAATPVWNSPEQWLEDLAYTLTTPAGTAALRSLHLNAQTCLDVAAIEARAADHRTGRHVTTAHDTVARRVGCSKTVVKNTRRILVHLGYQAIEHVGGYLTTEERALARGTHGRRQVRCASQRTLTTPRDVLAQRRWQNRRRAALQAALCPLPRRGEIATNCSVKPDVPKRAQARAKAPTTRPDLLTQRLAAALAQTMPWLAKTHIGALCRTLTAVGIDPTEWTAHDIRDLLDTRNLNLNLLSIPHGNQRDPLALFAFQLRQALPTITETPAARRRREAGQRAAARAATRAEHATAQANRATPEQRASAAADARTAISAALRAAQARPDTTPTPSQPSPAAWRTSLR